MIDRPEKNCGNCTSFDEAEGCSNAVSFFEPATGQYRRAYADDCCHDHERKRPELRLVRASESPAQLKDRR